MSILDIKGEIDGLILLKNQFSVFTFVTSCLITIVLLSMARGRYYISFDV